VENRAVYEII